MRVEVLPQGDDGQVERQFNSSTIPKLAMKDMNGNGERIGWSDIAESQGEPSAQTSSQVNLHNST
eukprot:4816052-Prorocentrum_lima.AAC.1